MGAAGRLRPAPSTRLENTKRALAASDLGALLLFDPNNIRYVTSTAIGTERDKNIRFTLVPRGADPILWDFGSAARHHQLYCLRLPESSWRAWVSPMRGAMGNETGIPQALAALIHGELSERAWPASRWASTSRTRRRCSRCRRRASTSPTRSR